MTDRSSYDLIVELLNQASLENSGGAKVILLKQVQELLIHKEPNLLDNFFDEMLGFQNDKSIDVRKTVISFIELACKVDGDILSKIIGNLNIMLNDENVNIRKKVILAMSSLYRTAVRWLVQSKIVTEIMGETWKYLTQMKNHIITLLDDDNDGIRTHSVKFCEGVILALTPTTEESEVKPDDQSLDLVPESESFLNKEELYDEGKRVFKVLVDFLGSQSITSMNLMACMTSMTSLARTRPQFIVQVIAGFESLHVNLPPTLSNSQVSSVRKSLKLQMLALLKHPAASDMISQIATLLTDLGATQAEVNRAMPKPEQLAANRKRKAETSADQRAKKASKSEFKMPTLPTPADDDDDGSETPYIGAMKPKEKVTPPKPKVMNPVDITTEDIIPRLTNNNVADLVLLSMVMLPDEMPAHFQSTYTPIAAAGTPGQIKHISRLLAVQLTNVGLGKGIEEQRLQEKQEEEAKAAMDTEDTSPSAIQVVGENQAVSQPKTNFAVPLAGTQTRKMKPYDLSSVTKPLSIPESATLTSMALHRILKCEAAASKANIYSTFAKITVGLAHQFGGVMREMLYNYIMADIKNRSDLAMTWVYNEYVNYHGFLLLESNSKPSIHDYEECLTGLLTGLLERKEQPGAAVLFTKLLLESPYIPQNAILTLKKYCTDEKHMYLGMHTLSELILKRPVLMTQCLYALLDFTYHEKSEVRSTAIRVVKDLYGESKMRHLIDEFCRSMISSLLQSNPSPSMFPAMPKSLLEQGQPWNEVLIKQALYMYLNILPDKPDYIDLLANVYVKTSSDIKRVILRMIEVPIKQMGMDSTDLLNFIKNSPNGSETLVTRIIQVLTERQAPSAELVEIVKNLYQERVADVRFIIPILSGLQKSEIYVALPQLIKLNPNVVKEVFNRLLGVGGHTGQDSALTPSELMVALHNIDTEAGDVKMVIKATSMCFQERSVFTQEVLAVVMQQLIETTPLPTLFMRTVIQSLTMYPKLLGFVLNILQRLIAKQVWKNKKAWEGFVRCCQRAKPQSFQVLLQLPAAQLKMVFDIAPDLRQPLLKHVNGFSAHQRAHIPKAVLAALEKHEVIEEEKKEVRSSDKIPETAVAINEDTDKLAADVQKPDSTQDSTQEQIKLSSQDASAHITPDQSASSDQQKAISKSTTEGSDGDTEQVERMEESNGENRVTQHDRLSGEPVEGVFNENNAESMQDQTLMDTGNASESLNDGRDLTERSKQELVSTAVEVEPQHETAKISDSIANLEQPEIVESMPSVDPDCAKNLHAELFVPSELEKHSDVDPLPDNADAIAATAADSNLINPDHAEGEKEEVPEAEDIHAGNTEEEPPSPTKAKRSRKKASAAPSATRKSARKRK